MSEKKLGKRLLTWVLVLVMTLSTLPLNVLADGDWEFFAGSGGKNPPENDTVTFTPGTKNNCTVYYVITRSGQSSGLTPFTKDFVVTKSTDSVVFYVATNNDKYALTEVQQFWNDASTSTNGNFYAISALSNYAGYTDACSKKCVAGFYYTANGYKDYITKVKLSFYTEQLPTLSKAITNITRGTETLYDKASSIGNLDSLTVHAGDVITYTFTVEYHGNTLTYSNVEVADSKLGDASTINFHNNNPQSRTYTVTEADVNSTVGELVNKAVLSFKYTNDYYQGTKGSAEATASATVGIPYRVIYDANGGTGNTPEDLFAYDRGAMVTVKDKGNLAKAGYDFAEWNTDINGNGKAYQADATFNITENTTLYAQWTPKNDVSYTVKYLEKDTNKVLKEAKTVTGQTFDTTVTETAEEISGYKVDGAKSQSLKLDAYNKEIIFYYNAVQPTTVTLTFDANGGAWSEDVSDYTMGAEKTTAAVTGDQGKLVIHKIDTNPVRNGYDFIGWYQNANCTLPVAWTMVEGKTLGENVTLYAGWSPRTAEKINCIIRQYFVDASGESVIPPSISNDINKGTLISDLIKDYAVNTTWQGQNYWYNASETKVNDATLTEGQKLTGDSIIDLYYYLDTWNDENDSTTEGDGIPDMYQAVVKFESGNPLFGKVEGSNCTQVFTLTDNDGNYVDRGSVTPSLDGVEATPLDAAVYRFSMWTKNSSEGSTKPTEPIMVNGGSTTVFKAQFEKIPTTYTVTYTDGVDGEEIFADQVTSDLLYNANTPAFNGTPTRDGYTFAGWSPKVAETVTGNATYTATWTADVATIKFVTNGGSAVKDMTGKTGDAISSRTMPTTTKSGYTFGGWFDNEGLTGTAVTQLPEAFPAGTTTYYAKWTADDATIKFVTNGGSAIEDMTGKTGDAISSRTMPTTTKSGYTFGGWFDNEGLTGTAVTQLPEAFPAGTTTYYAKWTRTSRPVTPPSRPSTPTVEIDDDDALGLNTTDHFAYIVGYGNGEVRPQNNITRAEVATIFFRLLTDDVRDANLSKTNRYSDVADTAWYNTAVSTLSSMGIITGYPDGTFRPNAAITRAEFAAIAARFDTNGDKTTAAFTDIASHWAKDEISIAANNGWIKGYEDNTFRPQRDITRAETMTLVNRVLNRQPETEDDLLPNMTVWTDNADKKAWYYLAVQEATNSHYYEFKTNSVYEKWTELRETRDWTQLEK